MQPKSVGTTDLKLGGCFFREYFKRNFGNSSSKGSKKGFNVKLKYSLIWKPLVVDTLEFLLADSSKHKQILFSALSEISLKKAHDLNICLQKNIFNVLAGFQYISPSFTVQLLRTK